MSAADRAWVAAIIEGEGTFRPAPGAARQSPVLGVESTDLDVIERLAQLTEVGHVNALSNVPDRFKPRWRWTVRSRAATRQVLTEILPQLGERRADRATYVLGVIGP